MDNGTELTSVAMPCWARDRKVRLHYIQAGLTTVLLVMMYGQTRIFYAMSRDKLIPPIFVTLHPAWRTPWISQILFGL